MIDLAYLLQDARRAEGFTAFLSARGCEVMVSTNPYEILRFKRHGRTNVVYKKRRGSEPNFGNLSREMSALHKAGFLIRESDDSYHAVEGMKVNIV